MDRDDLDEEFFFNEEDSECNDAKIEELFKKMVEPSYIVNHKSPFQQSKAESCLSALTIKYCCKWDIFRKAPQRSL